MTAADRLAALPTPEDRARAAGQWLAKLPAARAEVAAVRDQAVRDLRASGLTRPQIAAATGLPPNTVRDALRVPEVTPAEAAAGGWSDLGLAGPRERITRLYARPLPDGRVALYVDSHTPLYDPTEAIVGHVGTVTRTFSKMGEWVSVDGEVVPRHDVRRTAPGPIEPGDTVVGRAGTKYAGQVGRVSSTHRGWAWVAWPGVASEPWDMKVHCATADLVRVEVFLDKPAGGRRRA